MNYNYHTHTYRCGHAEGTPEEYIKRAIAGGITSLGFSEHLPLVLADGAQSPHRMKAQEAREYISDLSNLREKYRDSIEIKIGFEMEYYEELFDKMLCEAMSYGAEYLILGQHFIGIDSDYVMLESESIDRLKSYTENVIKAMQTGVFSYVAHPDAINFSGDRNLFEAAFREICAASRELQIPVEINFLGVRQARIYPNELFWKVAGEEKAPVVFGFDAHDVQSAFDEKSLERAKMLVLKYNLNYIGKPKLLPIK